MTGLIEEMEGRLKKFLGWASTVYAGLLITIFGLTSYYMGFYAGYIGLLLGIIIYLLALLCLIIHNWYVMNKEYIKAKLL